MTRGFLTSWVTRRTMTRRIAAVTGILTVGLGSPTSHVLTQALAAPLWTISGTVEAYNGHPIAEAPVSLSLLAPASKTPVHTAYIAHAVSGPDGSFSIPAPALSA